MWDAAQAAFDLLAELMVRDDGNLAQGAALLSSLHFERRDLLMGFNNVPEGPLRCGRQHHYLRISP